MSRFGRFPAFSSIRITANRDSVSGYWMPWSNTSRSREAKLSKVTPLNRRRARQPMFSPGPVWPHFSERPGLLNAHDALKHGRLCGTIFGNISLFGRNLFAFLIFSDDFFVARQQSPSMTTNALTTTAGGLPDWIEAISKNGFLPASGGLSQKTFLR